MNRGKILTYSREKKGLSTSDLAAMLGVSVLEVERWERGELPDSEHLLRLAEILDVSVEDILRGECGDFSERVCEDGQPTDGEPIVSAEIHDTEQDADGNVLQYSRCGEEISCTNERKGKYSHNGYYPAERKFGYFVFAVFVIVVIVLAALDFGGWVSRPRELTTENCEDYVSIEIVPERNYNAERYFVRVTAKENVSDFSIVIKVKFYTMGAGTHYETVALQGDFKKGASLEQTVTLGNYALETGYEVVSVHGGLD